MVPWELWGGDVLNLVKEGDRVRVEGSKIS